MNLIKQHPQSWLLPLVSLQSWRRVWPLYAASSSSTALRHLLTSSPVFSSPALVFLSSGSVIQSSTLAAVTTTEAIMSWQWLLRLFSSNLDRAGLKCWPPLPPTHLPSYFFKSWIWQSWTSSDPEKKKAKQMIDGEIRLFGGRMQLVEWVMDREHTAPPLLLPPSSQQLCF